MSVIDVATTTDSLGPEDRIARAALSRVIEPGDPAAIDAFAGLNPVEIWDFLRSGSRQVTRWAARLGDVRPEQDLERMDAAGGRFVTPADEEWPDQIEVLADAGLQSRRGGVPFGLWVRGAADLRLATERSVALVGSRACSSYGEHVASELAAGLADHGVTVVSGGAYGIDAAAHRGALGADGLTVAVLACGVDVSYPKGNTALFGRIAADGLLVSELPPGCAPNRLRFLTRNRLIAACALGTVVAEAAVRSGALNSAGWAEQCGRAVLAVPGPITSRMSEGAHLLVRERNAMLVTSVPDILEAVSPLGEHLVPHSHAPEQPIDRLAPDIRRVLEAVPVVVPVGPSGIASTAGLAVHTVEESLAALATQGFVERLGGGWRLSEQRREEVL